MFELSVFDFTRILVVILFFHTKFGVGDSKQEYLIETGKCKIPKYEPFNTDVLKLWIPQYYRACRSKPLLTYTTKTNDTATLHIREHLLPLYGKNVSCCVADVSRDFDKEFPDDKISLLNCRSFKKNVELNVDTVAVYCTDRHGFHVYRNVHSVIIKTTEVKTKMAKIPAIPKPISILFIVIDSVSRLNLIRTMPETRDYISQQGFIEMEGYNKVDDNTFPNFLALLNGMNKTQTRKMKCSGRIVNELDSCPMIWYDFRNLGYATAYGEDWGPLGTFNYMKAGFTKPPTDYYFRPYVLASEQLGTFLIDNAPYCAGPETSGERQLNLALDFAKTFKNCPYFGIFWMNTFSHQSINAPLRFDSKIRSFFADLKAEGILDDSIVVFLSDHGIRMDTTIRKTFSGWFEERLPMNLISVPKWFQEKYKEEYKNLKLNSKKLTSTHDLYMTLQHILKLSVPSYGISSSKACPKCVSLFDEVPNRTCSEAGIPEEWCTCIGQITPLNTSSEIVTEGIKFVLNYMDRTLDYYNATHSCCKLELDRVTLAGISETSELDNEKYLFLNFWTFPFADYIVTLKYKVNENKNNIFRILFEIIRLDRPTSICTINEIASSKIENFCHCCNREISNRL